VRIFFISIIFATAALSCSVLRTERPLQFRRGDWTTAGGDWGRTNAVATPLDPPLVCAWQYDLSAGCAASPLVADSALLVATLKGDAHAVRVTDGEGTGSGGFGASVIGTPVVGGDTIYIPLSRSDHNLIAYRLSTGKTIWKKKMPDIESSLLLMGDRLYVAGLNGTVSAVAAGTGAPVWSFSIPRATRTRLIRSSPASDGTTIVFGSDNGTLYAISADSGLLRWSVTAKASIVASPSVDSGMVFAGSLDSTFYAFDIATGKIIWQNRCGSRIPGGQAVASGYVYCGTAAGLIYCFRERSGVVVWKTSVGGLVTSAPLAAGRVLYVGCADKQLHALNRFTGEKIWGTAIGGRIKTSPVISCGRLFVTGDDRKIYSFVRDGGAVK
jgi:outer membrane protein assembly factor BamB